MHPSNLAQHFHGDHLIASASKRGREVKHPGQFSTGIYPLTWSVFGRQQQYKAELIHRRAPWKTRESVELATLEWVSWFNHHRLLEPIGYIPPAEAEANYYRQLASQVATPA